MSVKISPLRIYSFIEYGIAFYVFLYFASISDTWGVNLVNNKCTGIHCFNGIASDIKTRHETERKRNKEKIPKNQHNYKDLNDTISKIKEDCEDLCELTFIDTKKDIPDAKTFKRLNKTINCAKLWGSSIFDQNNNLTSPLQKLPKYLTKHFSRNNNVKILPYYLNDTNNKEDKYKKLGECLIFLCILLYSRFAFD